MQKSVHFQALSASSIRYALMLESARLLLTTHSPKFQEYDLILYENEELDMKNCYVVIFTWLFHSLCIRLKFITAAPRNVYIIIFRLNEIMLCSRTAPPTT